MGSPGRGRPSTCAGPLSWAEPPGRHSTWGGPLHDAAQGFWDASGRQLPPAHCRGARGPAAGAQCRLVQRSDRELSFPVPQAPLAPYLPALSLAMSGGHGKAYLRPALGLLAVLATYGLLQAPSGQGWTAGSARLRLQTCSRVPQLRGYFASTWESQFAAQVASAPACELGDKPERVGAWLAGAQAASGSGSGLAPRSQDVFSRFEWTDECSGDTIVQHIEPLVGHFRWAGTGGRRNRGWRAGEPPCRARTPPRLTRGPAHQTCRHPLAPHCNKNKTSTVDIQSRYGRWHGCGTLREVLDSALLTPACLPALQGLHPLFWPGPGPVQENISRCRR